jgi:hypothetical protein
MNSNNFIKRRTVMKNLFVSVLWFIFSGLAIAQVDLESGLVGYYSFDNVVDDTVVVNEVSGTDVMPNGIIRNEPVWTDGVSGDALLFSPSSTGHVAFGTYDPSADTDELSVSVWLNWNGLDGNWHSVCGKRDDWDPSLIMWDICLDMSSGGIQFETNTADGKVFIISPEPPIIGEWTHVVVTYGGSYGIMYMDGEWAIEGEMTFGLGRDAEFHLGCGTTGGLDPFNGAIDEFRVYNRVLSDAEATALFHLTTSIERNTKAPISGFMLCQNYPNPFNPTTQIQFGITEPAPVSLKVYDILGQEVATLINANLRAGVYNVTWDAKNSAGTKVVNGTYFYRLATGNQVTSKKMLLLK